MTVLPVHPITGEVWKVTRQIASCSYSLEEAQANLWMWDQTIDLRSEENARAVTQFGKLNRNILRILKYSDIK